MDLVAMSGQCHTIRTLRRSGPRSQLFVTAALSPDTMQPAASFIDYPMDRVLVLTIHPQREFLSPL